MILIPAGIRILFGSLAAVAVPAAAFWGGMKYESALSDARLLQSQNTELASRLSTAYEDGKKESERADAGVAATQALADQVARISHNGWNMQAELKRALDASGLALCLYPDDVRSVRGKQYEATRAATAATRD